MKRVIIVCIILALITVGSIFSFINLDNYVKETKAEIKYIKESVLSLPKDELLKFTETMIENWKKREKVMAIYLNRFTVDEVTWLMVTLPSYLMAGDFGEYMASLTQAEEMVEDLHYYNMPSFRNML